ncbi:putative bifunctional diguanylate cyclase/phosphodiesterase [Roseovarius nitratireducens]|uniref:putative bifunctional diguanylate cyclase/phosphodiesterase n=1 Tax=Roseovarius nitratireducens TaxID=2044597 RepID=UPI0019807409|nr:EAL domain-containing protein [Roseovarius nitratireducens]
MLLLVAPLFALFFQLSYDRAATESRKNIDLTMAASAQALGKPLWDFDLESVRKITNTIVSNPRVIRADVTDTFGEIHAETPSEHDDSGNPLQKISLPITFSSVDGNKEVGTLTVWIERTSFRTVINTREIVFLSIFGLAVLLISAAALIANRMTVIRPLLHLTDAIIATHKLGSRQRVDWTSNDEMGTLAKEFNEMQEELEAEEIALKSANALAQAIHNLTPAMLYSVDCDGNVSAVSDYWLLATGFSREDVISKAFSEFLDPASREAYKVRSKLDNDASVTSPGDTFKFTCSNGSRMDVLIRETITTQWGKQDLSLSVMTDVSELREAEQRNHQQAITDHLTGLLNRQGLEMTLGEEIRQTDERKGELACLFIDLDRFKWINDNLGHTAGDLALCKVTERMQQQVRPDDALARLGGDEFATLVAAPRAEHVAREVAERIARIFDTPFDIDGTPMTLSASIGIALYPTQARNAADLLQKSDMAMYTRKKGGRKGITMFSDDIAETARTRAEIESFIEQGLANDEFDAWLQPIIDLQSGRIAGFEALMRLNHPQKGIVTPADIIPVAEETGSINAIGRRIFKQALHHLAKISDRLDLHDTYLAVNFSPLQFEPGLPLKIMADLQETGISPSRIVVEVTEEVLVHDDAIIYATLKELSALGMRVALDDFGTGYSSMSYLHRFPVDIVKIDQSFIHALNSKNSHDKSNLLIEGINTIAHKLNCMVVAEGIETANQCDMLMAMGIEFGQGFYFARPAPADDLISQLAGNTGNVWTQTTPEELSCKIESTAS